MSYDIYTNSIDQLNVTDEKQIINTINPHSYVTAKNDPLFEIALRDSDVLLPDGSGIVLAAKNIHRVRIQKIAGMDLHIHLLEQLNTKSGKCFYMGASQNTLDKIKERLTREYPNITAEFYSPPFKPEFNAEDNAEIVQVVNDFQPDVLFVGMTAPKQEKWLYAHKNSLDFKVASSIGAVFDFYAGTVQRPSQFWIDLHLEWLPRLLKEPKRLWRRNFVSTPLFLWDMLGYKIGIKK
ncbi:WecB/TagA/CpsF family glycosyltransferase [Malikia sp.]|uniref:WecB/TagA/CpsF family glycosyltransferase n=1 Tax=Malikia sp. TaxID=2070706 RepID=UPI002606A6E5|nr:WecB/TagA/CpsF family glycosyltransferase [Malikia sp.]MDD2730487.1 WecB/TagA/CpsF family glycosyltransferase [Malikia sp.]